MSPQPWDRISTPEPIPDPLTTSVLWDLDDAQFELLMRSHLVPRAQDPAYRRQWDFLWTLLTADADLNASTTEFLQELLDYTRKHLADGALDETGAKRARKFSLTLQDTLKRIRPDRDKHGPWQWAPELAAAHPPRSRALIAKHLQAIARHRNDILRNHRKPTPADLELWNLLIDAGVRRR